MNLKPLKEEFADAAISLVLPTPAKAGSVGCSHARKHRHIFRMDIVPSVEPIAATPIRLFYASGSLASTVAVRVSAQCASSHSRTGCRE